MATSKYPHELGACIDLAYKQRAKRIAYERVVNAKVDSYKEDESKIEDHIINSFKKSEIEGAKGRVATAGIKNNPVAKVNDWDKFFAWMAKTKSWDMMQRRVNNKAYVERLEAKQVVPGTETFVKVSLSLTKR
jgi:hypothetical protein